MTKTNKKGFTLVELIIVIAILAILIAALAPALIKYIEKSRIKKDTSSLDNVYTTLKAGLDDEDVYKVATPEGKWVKLEDLVDITGEGDAATAAAKTGTGAVALLSQELFGDKGTLDIKYAFKPAEVFKSKAAAGCDVYVAIKEGKVAVCLSADGSAVKADFGVSGIVGDFTPSAFGTSGTDTFTA